MSNLPPVPLRMPMVDRQTLLVDRNWAQFFTVLMDRVGGIGDVAALGSTPPGEVLPESPLPLMAPLRQEQQAEALLGLFEHATSRALRSEETLPFGDGELTSAIAALRQALEALEALLLMGGLE